MAEDDVISGLPNIPPKPANNNNLAVRVLVREPGVNWSLGVGYVSESKKGPPEAERGWAGAEKVVRGLRFLMIENTYSIHGRGDFMQPDPHRQPVVEAFPKEEFVFLGHRERPYGCPWHM